MAYREKTAWLTLLAMALSFGPYLVWAGASPPGPGVPNLSVMGVYATAALGYAVLLGIGHLVLRMLTGPADRGRPDERDRAIDLRATRFGYGVLIAGMIAVGCIMPFTNGGWEIVNAAVAFIVLAEMVKAAVIGFSYRREAA